MALVTIKVINKGKTTKTPSANSGKRRGNPNHDRLGRFSTGKGSKGSKDSDKSYSKKYSDLTPHEYAKRIKKDYGSQTSFSELEKEEIGGYTDMGYSYTNGDLMEARGNKSKLDDYRKITVTTLDKSMRNKLKENTTLYRGMHLDQDLYVGDKIKTHGYSSTSFFKHKGESFATMDADRSFDTPYLLSIKANKGQKGIISILADDSQGLRAVEAEFILPRGLSFGINKRIEHDDYIELEVDIL